MWSSSGLKLTSPGLGNCSLRFRLEELVVEYASNGWLDAIRFAAVRFCAVCTCMNYIPLSAINIYRIRMVVYM